jgi:hypothetical protein
VVLKVWSMRLKTRRSHRVGIAYNDVVCMGLFAMPEQKPAGVEEMLASGTQRCRWVF